MKILVVGGTGTVGSAIVRQLGQYKHDVRVLTRDAGKAAGLPGVHGIVGDLLDPATVRTAFAGMDAVFLLNAVSITESHEGLMGLNGARLAGVKRLVYLSVQDVDKAPHLPHFGSKVGIEFAIKASGIPYTILRPNNYYQNDYWSKEALLRYGVYPTPFGDRGVSRVDVRDIADAAVAALTSDAHAGQTYNLVGPDVQTGATIAAVWSRALGREIAYAGDDLDAWEKQSLAYLPPWLVFDLRLMYAFFQEHGLKATASDIERLTSLLGHAPRSFEAFAAETAKQWA